MGRSSASATLRLLEQSVHEFSAGATDRKIALVRRLDRSRLSSARAVERFHEALCFLRAYPCSAAVLTAAEQGLARFESRRDVARWRQSLEDSGIAGTDIYYRFYWPIAAWLARKWPDALHLDWANTEKPDAVADLLRVLVTAPESEALDEIDFGPQEWLRRLAGPQSTDATFLVRRIAALRADPVVREEIHDGLDVGYWLRTAATTPSRTAAKYRPAAIVYRNAPLQRQRPVLRDAIREQPHIRKVSRRQGSVLVDMARAAMVTRSRDLYVFAHGDPRNVFLVDFGDGLQFAVIGFPPERRLLLHAVYGFLTLQNGVPIGYVLASALFGMTGVAYNTFETYRGGEAGRVFGRVLAMTRHLFGTQRFTIDPYQLGYGNSEGLKSGAWWFYYKLGFRPHDRNVLRVLRRELAAMRRNPAHRSSVATLEQLAAADVFLDLGPRAGSSRLDLLPLWNVSLAIADRLASRFGPDREAGLRACSREAQSILGVRFLRGFTAGERVTWTRWASLVVALPNVQRWTAAEKRDLVAVIRAKGGESEVDFVARFDAHKRLTRGILALAR